MLNLALTLLMLCAGALAAKVLYLEEDAERHFNEFIQTHDRQYFSEEEKQARFEIFKGNLKLINELNQQNSRAEFGISNFADMSEEELMLRNGYKQDNGMKGSVCVNVTDYSNLPEPAKEWDWRKKNAVTNVKNQDMCGSCYAFSAIGNLEGQYAIKNKELVSFSVQQIVDCDPNCFGCNGGWMTVASQGMIDMGGVETDKDYPNIMDENDNCMFDKNKIKAKVIGCESYLNLTEENLRKLVYHQGPLSIAIYASINLFFYKDGIIEKCPYYQYANHGVLLVGYGTENNEPYWIVKNSWNTTWGEKGYFRVKRGVKGCGVSVFETVNVIL